MSDRRRLASLLAVAALLAPATASAAGLGELAPTVLDGTSSCLSATGVPGELVRDAGGPAARLDVLHAGPGGFSPADTAQVGGEASACAAVAARPDGSALVAGSDMPEDGARILVASRAAGGAFGPPVPVASAGSWYVDDVVAGLSARGDAVVAWQELKGSRTRVRAILRPAGGTFGTPLVVASGRTLVWLRAAMSAGGDAILTWTTGRRSYQPPQVAVVHAGIAPAGGAFGASRVVAEAPDGRAPVLAVGDDGRALLALSAPGELRVAERPPGGAFGAPETIARTRADEAPQPALALGAASRAAIVWTTLGGARAWMVARAGAGPFGRVVTLSHARKSGPRPAGLVVTVQAGGGGGGGEERGLGQESRVAATLTPGGVLAAWLAPRRVAGVATTGVRTAFVPAAGGPMQRSLLGGGLRDAANVATFPTGDGGAGVAWLETGPRPLLHAALAGGARPADPPAPVVHVGRPFETALKYGRPLRLPVACDAACDVRVQIAGRRADGELSLARAGHGVLYVYPEGRPFATRRGGRVRLRVFSGAPGAAHPTLRTVSVRLRLRRPAPLPHPYALRAVRRPGDRIRVTWATAGADRRAIFLVYGVATRGGRPRALNVIGRVARRRFALTLRHVRGIRFVELHAYASDGRRARTLVVRVR